MKKDRLDNILTEQGYFPSRERAKAAIMAGIVLVDGAKIYKAGTKVDVEAEIKILGNHLPYVSRGGLKLKKAIDAFALDLKDLILIDIGASTGGFTDCALQHGAQKVYAVDVGYGQLDWQLRQDRRVIVLERTNARYLTTEHIPEAVDMVTIDASFISLDKILPTVKNFLKTEGMIVALIKPQFEAGRDKVGKKGVVRDPQTHQEVLSHVLKMGEAAKLYPWALTFSPVTGPEGNIEYLVLLKLIPSETFPGESIDENKGETMREKLIEGVVKDAFYHLKGKEATR
ncbi:MAG: TlyA family RNA methyltransferase [Dehalobacterium sp.]|jgi:23S rRNA (cytidine1920-2'-O)/16S rRNA (cytidine1409-2'-O)-methyltransferase